MSVKQLEARVALTVSEMAELVELSRARFYELIGTAFPHPVYDEHTRRPFYVHELRDSCLEVRRTGMGIDGRPVLFNRKRAAMDQLFPNGTSSLEQGEVIRQVFVYLMTKS